MDALPKALARGARPGAPEELLVDVQREYAARGADGEFALRLVEVIGVPLD